MDGCFEVLMVDSSTLKQLSDESALVNKLAIILIADEPSYYRPETSFFMTIDKINV